MPQNGKTGLAYTSQQQYRMIHDIYVLLQEGDSRILREFNLNHSQYALLLLLDEEHGKRLIDLSDRLLLARSTITRVVDQLEELGLVRRIPDPDDRRAQRVMLTPVGEKRRQIARITHENSLENRLGMLNTEEHRQLAELLDKVRVGLQLSLNTSSASTSMDDLDSTA